MGVGMILVVDADAEQDFLVALEAQGQTAFAMGEICADVEGVAWLD
jgi:phosphoribosylaminoimidazole (AIR) synthetase